MAQADRVLLVQLAPSQQRDNARLEYFLNLVPDSIRTAVEFRHPSWHREEVFELLERHGVAYCVMSGAGCHASCAPPRRSSTCGCTAGPDHLYAGSYSDDDLAWWADRIREWNGQGRRGLRLLQQRRRRKRAPQRRDAPAAAQPLTAAAGYQRTQKSSGSASTSAADRSSRPAIGSSAIAAGSPASAIWRMTPACRRARCDDHGAERVPVAVVAVRVEQEMKAAGPVRRCRGSSALRHARRAQRHPPQRGERQIELPRRRTGDVPVEEADQPVTVHRPRCTGRVLVADDQTRVASSPPVNHRSSAGGDEVGGHVMDPSQPLADLGQRRVGEHPRRARGTGRRSSRRAGR